MKRRNKNIRKTCDKINKVLDLLLLKNAPKRIITSHVKDLTHSIKRTTWRGEDKKFFRPLSIKVSSLVKS